MKPNAADLILNRIQEEFLRTKARNPAYSLRAYARRLGIPASALSQLLGGKRRITPKMARVVLQGLGVPPAQSDLMIRRLAPPSRRREDAARAEPAGIEFTQLRQDQYHVVADWFHYAVLFLTETAGFREDPKWIARRLRITLPQARQSLTRLQRTGLLSRDEGGGLRPTHSHITTTSDVADSAIRQGHFRNLDLARRSLESDPVADRDFSSLTVATSPEKLAEAKELIRSFRRALSELLESGPRTEVFQLNVQFFSLSKPILPTSQRKERQ